MTVSNKTYALTGHDLNLQTIEELLHENGTGTGIPRFTISEEAKVAMKRAKDFVFKIVAEKKPVYGINTGFGALSHQYIAPENLTQLQLNLLRSHCTGVGTPLPEHIVRTMLLIRANCLCSGHSGVNPEFVQLMLDFINHGVTPVIPEKGSVGASGDLAQLSHLAITLIGEGEVFFNKQRVPASIALEQLGKKAASIGPKDGLALINGTSYMTALGAIAIIEIEKLLKLADIAGALTVEALRGTDHAFCEGISKLRPHRGQLAVARNLTSLLAGSTIRESHRGCNRVQDAYSLRCMPQVHGACRQTYYHAKEIIETELNSVTDNPLIFPETGEVISGGNFHGETLALCMDYLCMGVAELCSISERRVEKMMNPVFSGLPPFLTENSGLNSGLMIAHVTHAALTSENKVYCHPASVDSIPTSTDKEDHVSMGPMAGRKLLQVLQNAKNCLAIEFLCNTQALEFHKPLKSSKVLDAVYERIREEVPAIKEDRFLAGDIASISRMIDNNDILSLVEKIHGALK